MLIRKQIPRQKIDLPRYGQSVHSLKLSHGILGGAIVRSAQRHVAHFTVQGFQFLQDILKRGDGKSAASHPQAIAFGHARKKIKALRQSAICQGRAIGGIQKLPRQRIRRSRLRKPLRTLKISKRPFGITPKNPVHGRCRDPYAVIRKLTQIALQIAHGNRIILMICHVLFLSFPHILTSKPGYCPSPRRFP